METLQKKKIEMDNIGFHERFKDVPLLKLGGLHQLKWKRTHFHKKKISRLKITMKGRRRRKRYYSEYMLSLKNNLIILDDYKYFLNKYKYRV